MYRLSTRRFKSSCARRVLLNNISTLSIHSSFLNGDGKDYRAFQGIRVPVHVQTHAHVRACIRAYAGGIYSSGDAPRSPRRNLTKERRAKNLAVKIKIFAAIAKYRIRDNVEYHTSETG